MLRNTQDATSAWLSHSVATYISSNMKSTLYFSQFADDQVIIADREDNLQTATHKLNQIITEYGLTISVQKTKSMAFRGRDPVRTKIVIDNKIIEQVNSFNYLGNMISYE